MLTKILSSYESRVNLEFNDDLKPIQNRRLRNNQQVYWFRGKNKILKHKISTKFEIKRKYVVSSAAFKKKFM